MKTFLVTFVVGIVVIGLLTIFGPDATRTTEYWEYNNATKTYELDRVEKEEIDGIFSEHAVVKTKMVDCELKPICEIKMK